MNYFKIAILLLIILTIVYFGTNLFKNDIRNKPTFTSKLNNSTLSASQNPSLFVANAYASEVKSTLYYSNGQKVDANVKASNENNGTVVTVERPSSFKRGKYKLIVDARGKSYEQDFTWGVLAINTNKSIYLTHENADLAIAVLDETGLMVCDANVTLDITSPSGATVSLTTQKGDIKVSPQCHLKQLVMQPDYETNYQVQNAGVYKMKLTAVTKNGTYVINDSFEVRESVPFEVERVTATRIFPPEMYPVTLKIKANRDFSGIIEDPVPGNFEISQMSGVKAYRAVVSTSNLTKVTWDVNLKKGDEIEIGYQYKAPNKSPDFYILGELTFSENGQVVFSEARVWQLAIDVISTVWLEAGTAETYDLTFWNGTGTTITGTGATLTSDTQAVAGSNRSLKALTAGTGSGDCAYTLPNTDVLADTGRRISFYARWSNTTPTTRYAFFETENSTDTLGQFGLALETSGKIGIFGGITSGSSTVVGNTVLQPNTDYRITVVYTITSSAVNSVTVYLNGNSEVTDTNDNQFNTGSKRFELGISDSTGGGPSKATTAYFAHVYVDNGTSGDPGDIRVTAKRPHDNGTSNNYLTRIGSGGSGYGNGRTPEVNERPLSNANGWSDPGSGTTEEYTIETAATGDVDISGNTLIDYMGWWDMKSGSTGNNSLILNGVATTTSISTTEAVYTKIAGSTTYPAGNTDIGVQNGGIAGPVRSLYEMGIIFAYSPVVPTPTPGVKLQGGMKIQGGTKIQ